MKPVSFFQVSGLAGTPAYNLVEFRTKPLSAHTVSNLVIEVEQKVGLGLE